MPVKLSGDAREDAADQKGLTETQVPHGPQVGQRQKGHGLSGVVYHHWGRTSCSGNATLVYHGKERNR